MKAAVVSFVPVGVLVGLCAIGGCRHARTQAPAPVVAPAPPLAAMFEGLGAHHRPITTRSSEAQAFFDQGLVLLYAANHDEAVRSFREAARLDPDAAMPWWGIATARGAHVARRVVDEGAAPRREDELQAAIDEAKARVAAGPAIAPIERALVDALASRSLREVHARFPDDADVATLFAEELLGLGEGGAKDGEEARAILERVLANAPAHPGANHLHGHLLASSPAPLDATRTLATADRLRTVAPGAGHLVHLSARLYARLGRWSDATDAGEAATAADRRYRGRASSASSPGPSRAWSVLAASDHQALLASALMEGREALASQTANELLALLPPQLAVATPSSGDVSESARQVVLVRFGRWDAILDEPPRALGAKLPVTSAIRRLGRGLASVRKGDLSFAEIERAALAREAAEVPTTAYFGRAKASVHVAIAARILTGEIAASAGDLERAIDELRAAAEAEDAIAPDEPRWPLPARHFLGAVLLEAGRPDEAADVYREDLERNPENGWSLVGLAQAIRASGGDAGELDARAEAAFRRADAEITSSRL